MVQSGTEKVQGLTCILFAVGKTVAAKSKGKIMGMVLWLSVSPLPHLLNDAFQSTISSMVDSCMTVLPVFLSARA